MAGCKELCRIEQNRKLAEGFYELILHAPQIVQRADCGQFVHVACTGKMLRRPLSICELDGEKGLLRLVYQVRGEGTSWLSTQSAGDCLDVLGPLGQGFRLPKAQHPVFVGGGLGVPPLLEAAKRCGNKKASALLGFRTADVAILTEDFASVCHETLLASDDGSIGRKGLVTDLLKEKIAAGECDYIAACGPVPMLRAVAQIAVEKKIPCEVSLEERMGCGMGACLVCVCRIQRAGEEDYLRVCKDGPVFWAQEVVF